MSRNFVYFSKVVRNVCRMSRVYSRLKRNKEWGIDPEFVQIRPAMDAWLTDLPHDLQLDFPADGSPPWLPSSFVGNMHSYYHLSIILFYRPQLAHMTPTGPGGQWKQHMLVSYRAAKMLCRLQEGIINQFGIAGLQCMQRGINFTLYAVLACIVLHLVCLHRRPKPFSPSLSSALLTLAIGSFNITGSGPERGVARIFHTSHAGFREMHGRLANARYAAADRFRSGSLFPGYQEAVCFEA